MLSLPGKTDIFYLTDLNNFEGLEYTGRAYNFDGQV
jgi:hypothetical protein